MKGSVKLPVFIDDARKYVNTTQLRAKYLGASYEAEYCQWQTLHGLGSLMETASLIITPNAYLEGKLIASYPPDPIGDLSVTRATTATRVNSAGLVELVPYNLVQYSEQFDNAYWSKNAVTITPNTTAAPNGTLTADTLTNSSTGYGLFSIVSVAPSTQYTFSLYVKKGTNTSYILSVIDANTFASIDSLDYSSQVGTEWVRVSTTFTTLSGTTSIRVYPMRDGSSVGTAFLWGAQLVEGSTAKDYQKTETRLNIPRLDYSNGTCPSLLVEPQRTNLLTYSSSFDNAAWAKSGVTATANDAIAPDGTLTADKLVFSGSGKFIYQLTATSGQCAHSIYIKGTAGQTISLDNTWALDPANVFTLNGEWQRFDFTSTTSSGQGQGLAISTFQSATATTIWVWGAQLEAGNYSTSYIPTTSASVTRNADVISKTGISSLIGQTEGVLFAQMDITNFDKAPQQIAELHQDANNRFGIAYFWDSFLNENRVQLYQFFGGNLEVNIQATATTGIIKIAIGYKANDYVLYINGQQIGSDNSASVPTTSTLYLGSNGSNFFLGNGVNSLALWPTRLTNTQLAQLTSI